MHFFKNSNMVHKIQHIIDVSLTELCFLVCVNVSSQSEMSPQSGDSLMSGFLLYGDDPKTWQQVWCVITRTEPLALYLYTAPQVGRK